MHIKYFIILLAVLLSGSLQVTAQSNKEDKNPRILILLDGSSSMLHEWTNDNIRFEAAAKIIDKLMDSVYAVNKDVEFALRVYGHQSPTSKNNCYDTKLEVMFSKDNYTQMMLRLAALSPLGISPIAYSLQQAAEHDMKNLKENKYSLILITDGGESCNGDICKVVEELLKQRIDFKPYILSLVDYKPLRQQYACLGDYLLVTSPEDIEPVVGKIVESYRHTFIQPASVTKLIETTRKPPSVLKITTPQVKIPVPEPEPKPEPKKEEPKPVVITAPEKKEEPVKKPEKPSKIVVQEIKAKPSQQVTAMRTTRQQMMPQYYFSRSFTVVGVPDTKVPEIEVEPERPKQPVYKPMNTQTTKTAPVANRTTPEPKAIEYSVSREEAEETSLEIFFTDGKGTYYETAPEVVLRDMKTNEPVYKFNRFVDVYGKPRPQKGVPTGTFNLTITGKDGFVASNIEIRPNEKNKYALIIPDGSLGFIYRDNPKRPVTEFAARVSVALKRGAVNKQYCSDIVAYKPENYHIIVNTNPITQFNVDLDFGVTVYIAIDEPGQIKVLNPHMYKEIQFFYQHGERYEQFKPMDVTGDIRQQQFLIQPGRYKIGYIEDPLVPNPKPKVKSFIIKSNVLTEVTLD